MADENTSPFVAEASAPGLGTETPVAVAAPVAPVAPPAAAKPPRTAKPRKTRTPEPVVVPVSVAEPEPVPVTLDQAMASIQILNWKLESMSAALTDLRGLVLAQTTLLTALAAAKPAPAKSATPVNGLAEIGERNARVQCNVVGPDGKPHGVVTVNRFKHCPTCYNEAHYQASARNAA